MLEAEPAREPHEPMDKAKWVRFLKKHTSRELLLQHLSQGIAQGITCPVVAAMDPRGGGARKLALRHCGITEKQIDMLVAKLARRTEFPLVVHVFRWEELAGIVPRFGERVARLADPETAFSVVCFWGDQWMPLEFERKTFEVN